jgi:hypothetical protein
MSLKNPLTSPGIDPGTVRLVAQRLNHYATPGPTNMIICLINSSTDILVIVRGSLVPVDFSTFYTVLKKPMFL